MNIRDQDFFIIVVLAVPAGLATALAGVWYMCFQFNPEFMTGTVYQSSARFLEPTLVYEHFMYPQAEQAEVLPFEIPESLTSSPAAPYTDSGMPLRDVPLGKKPASLYESLRVLEYCELTANRSPYSTYPHPRTLEQLTARKSKFDQFTEVSRLSQFNAGIELRFSGLDFLGYFFVFSGLGLLWFLAQVMRGPLH